MTQEQNTTPTPAQEPTEQPTSIFKEGVLEIQKGYVTDLVEDMGCLNDIVREEAKRVPENVFRRLYLPMFAGIPEKFHVMKFQTDKGNRGIQPSDWLDVVGNSGADAFVVNENDEVLFVVPPMIPKSVRRLSTVRTKASFGIITEKVREVIASGHPLAIQEYTQRFQQELNRIEGTFDKTLTDEVNYQWHCIYAYYGFVPGIQPVIDAAAYFYDQMKQDPEYKEKAEEFFALRAAPNNIKSSQFNAGTAEATSDIDDAVDWS